MQWRDGSRVWWKEKKKKKTLESQKISSRFVLLCLTSIFYFISFLGFILNFLFFKGCG